MSSEISVWYLEDATLGRRAESVFEDVRKCVTELKTIGLDVNPSKCEVINMSYPVDEFTELMTTLTSDLPDLRRTELADMVILGSAILDQAVKKAIANKLHTYHLMTHLQQQLDTLTGVRSHPSFSSICRHPSATRARRSRTWRRQYDPPPTTARYAHGGTASSVVLFNLPASQRYSSPQV